MHIIAAKNAANGRPQNKANAKGNAQHAEILGAFFGLAHIGDIGAGGCNAGRGDAGNNAADEKP